MTDKLPHRDAPDHVWHHWLCHNSDPRGDHGESCPDGCDTSPDPHRLALYRGQNDVVLYMALAANAGWRKQVCKDPEHAYDILQSTKRTLGVTHWATCPVEKDDGGLTPPPGATIREVNNHERRGS